MSTKTTIKSIALVAVAALGFGLVSVAPSSAAATGSFIYHGNSSGNGDCNAAANYACSDYVNDTSWVIAGSTATYGFQQTFNATAALDTLTSTWSQTSAPVAGYAVPLLVITGFNGNNAAKAAANFGQADFKGAYDSTGDWGFLTTDDAYASATALAAAANATTSPTGYAVETEAANVGGTVGNVATTFTPTVVGTYVFTLTTPGATTHTWTIKAFSTQAAMDASKGIDNVPVAAKTTSILNAGTANSGTTDAVVSAPTTATTTAGSQTATILVTPKNAAGTAIVGKGLTLTATIAGPGTLAIATTANKSTTASVGRAITGGAEAFNVLVFADGTPGVATVTISSGSTVLSTETITFYGAVASYTATVKKNVIEMSTTTAAVILVVAKDSAGNVVPSQPVNVKASDSTVVADTTGTTASAAEAAAGTATLGVVGISAKFGKLTLTISNGAGTISTTAVVTLSSTTAKTVTLAFDKAEYSAGEKMTLKVTAVDVNGLPVASMDPITTLVANTSLFGYPATLDSLTTDGSVSYTMYAPLVPGPITLAGTDSNAAAITASAAVISNGVAEAAVDAANEAIDAANAATDAANAAAEAADAATAAAQDAADAVAALSVAVTAQIDALKAQNDALRKQLIALTNLIIKIQKKVKA